MLSPKIVTGCPMEINLQDIFHALSDTLDLVGIDDVYHGKRVACMAHQCAGVFGFSDDAAGKIYDAGLIHDCGVSSTEVHRYLTTDLEWQGSQEHCIVGAELLRTNDFVPWLAPLVRYHHCRWQDLQNEDLTDEEKLMSNCIYIADRADALLSQRKNVDVLHVVDEIRQILKRYSGTLFSPELMDAFQAVSRNEFFWLHLSSRHIDSFVQHMSANRGDESVRGEKLLTIANIFARIVDAKSPFTAEHSCGVSQLAKFLAQRSGLAPEVCDGVEIAGLLHDLGKLNIPDEILEKPGPLNADERSIMIRHSFETYQILRRMKGVGSIADWAAFHHEKLNGRGYPFRLAEFDISREARIIAVADIFQALVQNRPYRKGLRQVEIVNILDRYVEKQCIDRDVVELVHDSLDECFLIASCHSTGQNGGWRGTALPMNPE